LSGFGAEPQVEEGGWGRNPPLRGRVTWLVLVHRKD